MRDDVYTAPETEPMEDERDNDPVRLLCQSSEEADTIAPGDVGARRRGLRRFLAPPQGDATLGAGWLDAIGLAEGGLLADVGIVLDLASIYLPLVGPVFSPAVPTPFALLMLRRGPRVTLLAAAVAMFLITVIAGPHFGWRMGLQALIGLLLGWAMRRRLVWPIILALGTLVVATASFCAVMGVIFLTGLPIADVIKELQNTLITANSIIVIVASFFGFHAQWLAIRPGLLAIEQLALRFWYILEYLYLAVFALGVVTLYYMVANAAVRVLGHQVRPFPPIWLLRLIAFASLIVLSPILLPLRGVARLRRHGRGMPVGEGS